MENNENNCPSDNNLLINFNINNDKEEKDINDIEDNIEEGEFFYGNDYTQILNNIFINENKENENQIMLTSNSLNELNEFTQTINVEKTINIICKINPETITNLFTINKKDTIYKSLLKDKIGQIDFNSVIIREFLPDLTTNIKFYNKYFEILSKVVYPTIQIFYGILNKDYKNCKNIEIILEYISSDFEEVLFFLTKCLNGDNISYLIINKISEVLLYIYECGYPYLMLYPSNIKFNNKLFKQYFQVDEDSTYLYTINKNYFSDPSKIFSNNFMKISNVGTYLKYKYLNSQNNKYYSLKDELLSDICFFSPELIKFILDEEINDFPEDINILEKWDVYSFGCLLFYIFYQKYPYFFIINSVDRNEIKYQILIDSILNEDNFLKKQINNFEKEKNNNVPDDIVKIINDCTCNQAELRPTFNNIFEKINLIIKGLNDSKNNQSNKKNCKDIFHDYSFYQLSKYNDDLIVTQEILKNNKYKQELIDINEEYKNSKAEFINYYKQK